VQARVQGSARCRLTAGSMSGPRHSCLARSQPGAKLATGARPTEMDSARRCIFVAGVLPDRQVRGLGGADPGPKEG
jgi:hypothetical protein